MINLSSCCLAILLCPILLFMLPGHEGMLTLTSGVAGYYSYQPPKPLTEVRLEELIKNKTPDSAIATEILKRGLGFRVGSDTVEKFRRLGAGAKTIQAIEVIALRPPVTKVVGSAADEEVGKWLSARGYVLYEPLGVSLPPATVFIVKGSSAELVMSAREVMPPEKELPQSSALPQLIRLPGVELGQADQLPFLPGVDVVALAGLGVKTAVVHLGGIRAETVSLSRLQDAIKEHPKLKEKVRTEQRDLLIVFEAIRATQIRLTLLNDKGVVLGDSVDRQQLQAALGADFKIVTGGTHLLSEEVSLGIKAAGLSSVSTVLGGGREELRLKEIPAESLQPLFREEDEPASLSSGYQVFGLVVGQGNYRSGSDRVGAALPGVFASAELTAQNFQHLVGSGRVADVRMIVSRKGLVDFDKTRPLTKQELSEGIAEFVKYVRENADPAKQSIVLFYYFGHGLADEKLHTIYLVPEGFQDRPERPVVELDEGLISVNWVRDQLEGASDNVIMLVDACRQLDGPDDLEKLRAEWSKLVIKPPLAVGETLDVIKFMGGLYGPKPMLFGSEDGTNARVVPRTISGEVKEIGPLSLKLQLLLDDITARGQTLSASDFIRRMGEPADVTLPDGKKLRAYTALRQDFLESLPRTALVSTTPQALASRPQPFVPPLAGARREALPPGKTVAARKLNDVPLGELRSFIFVPASKMFYLLNDQYNIYRWSGGTSKPLMIWEDKEISLPVIGGPVADAIYLYRSDSKKLYLLDTNGGQTQIGEDLYLGLFGRGLRGNSVIAVGQDATVGTADPVYRLTGRKIEQVASFDTTDVFDLLEWQPGAFYFSVPGEGAIQVWLAGKQRVFKAGLSEPGALAATDRYLYCMSRSGEVIYRIDAAGNMHAAATSTSGQSAETSQRLEVRNLYAVSDEELYYASGTDILRVTLEASDWRPISSGS
jgi:hypothetical protein